MWLHVK